MAAASSPPAPAAEAEGDNFEKEEKERKFKIIPAYALLRFPALNKLFMQIHVFFLTLCYLHAGGSVCA